MQQKLTSEALSFTIGNKKLLDNISLEFAAGKLHCILGPNGSGKSTLLKTLCHIWKPISGCVRLNGELISTKNRRMISRLITLVPQNPQPNFDFIVEDIVAMGRYPHGALSWSEKEKQAIYSALRAVDGLHLCGRLVNQLSQGEKQRIYIARALITESPVLLLDEPTASLDVRHQLEILQLLKQQVQRGKIIVITTHDLSLAKEHCDQIAVLSEGNCIGQDSFASLITNTLLQRIFGVIESPQKSCMNFSLP